jgi:endoglycosylceramidase
VSARAAAARAAAVAAVVVAAALAVGPSLAAGRSFAAGPSPAAASARATPEGAGDLRPAGRWLKDPQGRVVIVHGLQVAHKTPPYHPPVASFGARDARRIARWGFNAIRLAWFWKGLEPARGKVDAAYARELAREGAVLARAGLRVQLEAHQDLFNEAVHGAGFPDWATLTDGIGVQPASGAGDLFGAAGMRAFDNFYADREGIAGAFARAWTTMARAFAAHPPALGYDLFNEPQAGSANPACFAPAGCPDFDRTVLGPLQDRLAAGVRAADRSRMVWYEPAIFFDFGVPTSLPAPAARSRPAGFAFHAYCLGGIVGARPDAQSKAPGYADCPATDERVFRQAARAARAMGPVPPLFGEFGDTQDLVDIRRLVALADRRRMGWVYWGYKDWVDVPGGLGSGALFDDSDDDSTVRRAKLAVLSEPYPMATAGTPGRYGFDPATRRFSYRYRPDRRVTAPTVVFAAPLHYRNGYDVAVRGARVVSAPDAARLVLRNRRGAVSVRVSIVPARRGRSGAGPSARG